MSKIDYKQPFSNDSYFQEYLKSKEESLKTTKKQSNPATRPQNSHMWAIVFVLMVSLVALGIVSLLQYRTLQNTLATINQSVAGVSETSQPTQNIITADGFSIVLNTPTPDNFSIERSSGPSEFLESRPAVTTSILAQITRDEETLTSGISVAVTEYDNKLDRIAFAEQVLTKLGPEDYTIASEQVEIPRSLSLTKITLADGSENVTYYTGVTARNYYVIRAYNETAGIEEYAETTRFTDQLIQNIYIN